MKTKLPKKSKIDHNKPLTKKELESLKPWSYGFDSLPLEAGKQKL